MSDSFKPRIRVQAGSSLRDPEVPGALGPGKAWAPTEDSFKNAAAALGYGTNNISSGAGYGFNPITRTHTVLAFMYRGSWLPRKVVDQVADDMTRAGLNIDADTDPDAISDLHEEWRRLKLWDQLRDTIKWARLYGGAMAVMVIDGQAMDTPLDLSTIGKGAFKGVMVFDRWVVFPDQAELLTEVGPNFGMPKYYNTMGGYEIPTLRIHHSRCLRFEGDPLPYWQKITEMGWGASVIEQLYDRMLAFDAATTGAAQLIYKAHLRTYKVQGLRNIIASGQKMMQQFYEQVYLVRQMQTNEGLTVIDAEDALEYHANSAMSGISDALSRFGEQIAGATGIPLVILFGQSPSGFSTGDTDIRNYYDRIASKQQSELDEPIRRLITALYWSKLGKPPPPGWSFSFNSLWQMSDDAKANIASTRTTTITAAHDGGLISDKVAMQELKAMARETGMFSNITEEDIEGANEEIPDPAEAMGGGMPGMPGAPGADPGDMPGGPPKDGPLSPFSEAGKGLKGPAAPGVPEDSLKAPGASEKPDKANGFAIKKTKDGMRRIEGIPGVRLKLPASVVASMKTNIGG